MGLLDQLWDDTVAGPRPDSGLGKLRKYASFSPSSSTAMASPSPASAAAADVAAPTAVTRSITILRPPALSVTSPRGSESGSSSTPSSPASVPDSPFGSAPTPKGAEGWKKLRRKAARMGDGVDAAGAGGQPRSPTVYDWVVISSLDR
uniref:Auxin-repressed protein n=1 Tax=Leersia perrieri TaxID=77586 RepID=A0A0D9XE31_9ORYZ